jgi:hypothetical protein
MNSGMFAISVLPFLTSRERPADGAVPNRRLDPAEELRVYGCAVSARTEPRTPGTSRSATPRLLTRSWATVLRTLPLA